MKRLLWMIPLLLLMGKAIGQNGALIGDTAQPPHPSAILELRSNQKGFLMPRLTTTQRNAIVSPANGLMLYNTTTKCIQAYLPQTGWRDVVCDCQTPPVSTFSYNPNTPGINSNITFTPTTPGMNYSWTFQSGNPATSTSQSPVVQWSSPGTYQVSLTVSNNQGCSSTTTLSITVSNCPSPGGNTMTFNYTGSSQTWTVPNCVFSVNIQCFGAQGGGSACCSPPDNNDGGMGGLATGTLAVTPGQVLYIYVGGQPQIVNGNNAGGWNGGGGSGQYGGGGGGASDVRVGGQALNNRVIVGGGGGGGNCGCPDHGSGGAGGGLNGVAGLPGSGYVAGGGGTQNSGGTAGSSPSAAGSLGLGGDGNGQYHVGGGGGGYYGGGSAYASGGGGGSSYYGGVTSGATQPGVRNGHGQVIFTY